MALEEFKQFLQKNLEAARSDYLKDLESMPEELLAVAHGGVSRTPYDFTYEVVVINFRVAKRLRGETPAPYDFEGWITAPMEFRSKEAAKNGIDQSLTEILAGLDAIPSDQLLDKIVLPKGETSAADLCHLASHHTNYHDAQLNYIQAMQGDSEVHW